MHAGDEELRPVMKYLFWLKTTAPILWPQIPINGLLYRTRYLSEEDLVISAKTANILKTLLAKITEDVKVSFDKRRIIQSGAYSWSAAGGRQLPAYRSVFLRITPLRSLQTDCTYECRSRVRVCSTRLHSWTAFSRQRYLYRPELNSALPQERFLTVRRNSIERGFNSTFLAELLSNLPVQVVLFSDPPRWLLHP
jgi:hypothetical protein